MKVGDYVRYKNGEIEKIHSFSEKDNPLFNILINARYHNTNEIIKCGEPIDLIEVGDYVNGLKVAKVEDNVIIMVGLLMRLGEEDIKSILTHEQFERYSYKVGE